MIDTKDLIGEVAARNGIRLEPDDPAFALVTLNELVLERAIGEIAEQVRGSASELAKAAEKVHARAGVLIARELKDSTAALREDVDRLAKRLNMMTTARTANGGFWACVGAILALFAFAGGLTVGLLAR